MTKPIAVVGSINMDLVVAASRLPVAGETLIGRSFEQFHGGKGANQAVAAAKLGHPVMMVGAVGDDSSGPVLRAALALAGVDTSLMRTVAGPSGTALITTAEGGANMIMVVPGANAEVTPPYLESCGDQLRRAGMLLAQLEIPLESIDWLAWFAEREGLPLVLDPAPACDLPGEIMKRVTWLTPNETESIFLAGQHDRPEQAADALLARGAANVLLKLGQDGCLIAQGGQPKCPVRGFDVDATDTTAAGDAFNGAFAVAMMRGEDVVRSATFANAVAALSVTKAGAQPSMPTADEVAKFVSQSSRVAA